MIPNYSSSLSFQMKILKNLDRKSDSVGPFISAVKASEVWACKGYSKGLLWSLGAKSFKNVFRSSKNDPEWFQIIPVHFHFKWKFWKIWIEKVNLKALSSCSGIRSKCIKMYLQTLKNRFFWFWKPWRHKKINFHQIWLLSMYPRSQN